MNYLKIFGVIVLLDVVASFISSRLGLSPISYFWGAGWISAIISFEAGWLKPSYTKECDKCRTQSY